MNKPDKKKLSRRDAIKLIGAVAGASVLANLPSKWSSPMLTAGVLPAHAQTSASAFYSLTCDTDVSFQSSPFNGTAGLTVSPNVSGIQVNYLVLGGYNPLEQTADITGLPANPVTTGPGGIISIPIQITVAPLTANSGDLQVFWQFVDQNLSQSNCTQVFSWSNILPMLPTVVTVLATHTGPTVTFDGNLTSDGGSAVTDRGFVWSASNPNPTTADNVISLGAGGVGPFQYVGSDAPFPFPSVYLRAYATNSVGTAYGSVTSAPVCLVEGTLVTMADGTGRKIEDITHSDWLRVWNFDEGRFDTAQPLWIKKRETITKYNLLKFSDGSSLKTVYQHRIFNKELGAFTFPMTEDTPIGTTTFNVKCEEVTLVSKQVVQERVRYYNVITHRHMNLFANGILTSCMYNNLYPIRDMKFVKEHRKPIPQEQYDVESKYYEGLRLAEQTIPVTDTLAYINRLRALDVETELAVLCDRL